jgi:hypothetical protein
MSEPGLRRQRLAPACAALLDQLQRGTAGVPSATLATADGLSVASTLGAAGAARTRCSPSSATPAPCSASCSGPAAARPNASPPPLRAARHPFAPATALPGPERPHSRRTALASTPKDLLQELMQNEGALCAAPVDCRSGMLLESAGTGIDLELAAAGNTEVVRAKLKTMKSLGLNDTIEDILISLGKHCHIIRPAAKHDGLFMDDVLDRARANPAMARRKVLEAEALAAV